MLATQDLDGGEPITSFSGTDEGGLPQSPINFPLTTEEPGLLVFSTSEYSDGSNSYVSLFTFNIGQADPTKLRQTAVSMDHIAFWRFELQYGWPF